MDKTFGKSGSSAAPSSTYDKIKETGKHGIIYGFTNALVISASVILIPIYTRYIEPKDYGILSLIVITQTILFAIFNLGIQSAFFRFYFDYDDKKSRITVASTAFTITLISAVALAILGAVISPTISKILFGNTAYTFYIQLMCWTTSFQLLLQLLLQLLRAQRRSKEYAIFNISNFFFRICIIIYLVVFANWGILGIIVGQFATSTLFFIMGMLYLHEYFIPKLSPSLSKKMLRFGVPLIFSGLSAFVLNLSDQYLLNFFRSLEEVGIYALGVKLSGAVITLLVTPLALVWGPMRFEVMHQKNANTYYRKMFTYFIFAGISFFLVTSLLAIDGIEILAGKEYWGAYIVIPWIVLSLILVGCIDIISLGIVFKKKTKYTAIIITFSALINVLMNLYFIPVYGIIGAAFTTLISNLVAFILFYYVSQRLYPIKYEWKRMAILIGAASMIFAVGWWLPVDLLIKGIGISAMSGGELLANLLSMIIRGSIALIYPFGIYACGFFDKNEKESMHRLLRETKDKIRKTFMRPDK